MKNYDLVVIGSGAGLMVVEAAVSMGLTCALIEKAKLGGTCLTKGCIPSKMLVYPADLIRETQSARKVGLDFQPPRVDWEKIADRMWQQINFSQKIEKKLQAIESLTVYRGDGEFTRPDAMRVHYPQGGYSEEFTSPRFVIAAGARSFVPPVEGLNEAGYIVPETFFGEKFPHQPWKNLAIIGGGAIGAEFAHIFSAFGTKVTLIEMKPRLLPVEEEVISLFVEKQFASNNIDVYTNTRLLSAGRNENGKTVTIESMTEPIRRTIACEEIFFATGIRSNADWLKIENTQVKLDDKGWIMTDSVLATSQNGIWALGDINGKFQFRHKANHEAEILIHNLFAAGNKIREISYAAVPWAIFTSPQVAHVGLTELEAKNGGLHYRVGINHYSEVAGGIAMGFAKNDEDNGFVKIIVGEDKKIIGAHIVGPHASILLQPFVYLMNTGQKCPNMKILPDGAHWKEIKELKVMCPQLGTYLPISDSMVIHPSLNELAAWVIEKIVWETDGSTPI
jgi:mycothione reductase